MSEPQPVEVDPAPGPDRLMGWREIVLTGTVALAPALVYLSNQSIAVLIALGGLLLLPLMFRPHRPILGLAFLVALAAWALTSMNWSIFQQPVGEISISIEHVTALKMLLELGLYGAFFAAAANLPEHVALRITRALTVGLLLLAALFLVEGFSRAGIYLWMRETVGQPTDPILAGRDVSRSAYALVLLFWPLAMRLEAMKLRWAAVAVAAATVTGAILLGADAPVAALAVSALVFALVLWGGRRALWACMAGAALYFLAAPLVIHEIVPADFDAVIGADPARLSWAIRLDIWRFVAERILERPFTGWGLDASRMFSPDILLHPHNAALQLWLELGAVGAGLAALFWAWVFGRLDRAEADDRPMTAAAAATASVYLIIGALSFGIWQEWWIALGVLAAASCAMGFIARHPRPRPAPRGEDSAA